MSAKFRERERAIVKAEQWQPGCEVKGVKPVYEHNESTPCAHMVGGDYIEPGDWVVTFRPGVRRVWTNAAFVKHFEPVPP